MPDLKLSPAIRAAGVILALAASSFAVPAEQTKEDSVVSKPAHAQPQMVMTRDAATGKLRPATAAEQAELERQTAAASAPKARVTAAKPLAHQDSPKMIQGKGGAVGMVLDDETRAYSVATKSPDNKIVLKEVTGKKSAAQATTKAESHKGGSNEK